MKTFIIKILLISLIIVCTDLATGLVFKQIYLHLPNKDNEICHLSKALLSADANLLIVGSSTAERHYDIKNIEDTFQKKVFNAGVAGHNIIYCDILFQAIVEREPIDVVIIDVCNGLFDGSFISNTNDLIPFYKISEQVTTYYKNEAFFLMRVKMISALYRYNSSLADILKIFFFSTDDSTNHFKPLDGTVEDLVKTTIPFNPSNDELYHLSKLVKKSQEKGIKLVFVISPTWQQCDDFLEWINTYCKYYNIPLINEMLNSEYYYHTDWFYDRSHLNRLGAIEFTSNVCRQLDSILYI